MVQKPQEQLYVLDVEAATRLWLVNQVETGKFTQQQALQYWNDHKDFAKKVPNYWSTKNDIQTLMALWKDLKSPLARVVFKEYKGKAYIIFKGYPGIRKIFTGTRYGAQNAKVVEMGLGRAGIRASAKGGIIISAVLLTAFDITEYFLSDRETLGQLLGQIASDVTKAAIAGGIGMAAGIAAGFVIGSFALGPLVVAVAVAVGVGLALDALDERFHLTEKVQALLDSGIAKLEATMQETRQGVLAAGRQAVTAFVSGVVDLVEDEAIGFLMRQINGVTWRFAPRL